LTGSTFGGGSAADVFTGSWCDVAAGGIALSGCVLLGLCFSSADVGAAGVGGGAFVAFATSARGGTGGAAAEEGGVFNNSICPGREGAEAGALGAAAGVADGCVWSGLCAFCESATNVTV
jgi:hypothetical protein